MEKTETKNKSKNISTKPFFVGIFLVTSVFISYKNLPDIFSVKYIANIEETEYIKIEPIVWRATHIEMPEQVKAIYMTVCAGSSKSFRDSLINLIDTTELNSIVLNVKDETGKIGFDVDNPDLQHAVADLSKGECKITDIKGLIEYLHSKNIYVIGRIPVFQDLHFVAQRPDLAVKRESDGGVWQDRKGIKWLDAGAKEVWDYIVAIGNESFYLGFDELNFDYIRFPSDGNMRDIYYPFSEEKVMLDIYYGKAKVLQEFFSYLSEKLRLENPKIVLSADLFGMTATNYDDLNIGQVLEYATPYFDYVAPMVYPSHYPTGFNGWQNPNHYPYEVVKFSMDIAVERLNNATTSPLKLRPWLQDFDYGGNYDEKEVRAQIQATYDAGLTSWMLWSASNKYTKEALEKVDNQ